MCGVVAALRSIDRALDALAHRGLRAKQVGTVGHVRLPIVGIGEEFDQPVRRGDWTIAFVGEVLDFRDADSRVECDLDVVVRSFLQSGPRGLCRRDGFWSVVALNESRQEIVAFVDYLAQKPLYYRTEPVAVASEPMALLEFGALPPDEVYLSAVAKWGYCPEPGRTPWEGMTKLPPGCAVTLRDWQEVQVEKVDSLVPRRLTDDELCDEIVKAAARRVVASDVPVACLVSGGLDSSIVYTLARRFGEVVPYHVENDELGWARLVAPDVRVAPMLSVTTATAARVMQEPIDLGSLVPQLSLSCAVQERVCLTGDGADELFGGYGRSSRYDSQASDVWHELVMWHLPRLDRIMAGRLIEVRSPFLARRVVEAALATPWSPDRQDKARLRRLFKLPEGIADRPKRPLRTRAVEADREARSLRMVDEFRRFAYA